MSETNKKPSMLSDLLLTCLATGALGGAISIVCIQLDKLFV